MIRPITTILHNDVDENEFPSRPSANQSSPEAVVPKKAFSTDDALTILGFASQIRNEGGQVALCTLVEIRGGSSRPLGAHMAVAANGLYCGYVSGGCTEAAVAAEALEAINSGHDRFMMLGEGSPFFDIVLPCGGGITVAIHVLKDAAPLRTVLEMVRGRKAARLSYNPSGQRLSVGETHQKAGWGDDAFVTCYRPAVRVVLSGRSLEVEMAASVARAAGYEVFLQDQAGPDGFDISLIDDDTAVALLQHDLELEMPVLEAALSKTPFYVGALGSSRTHEKRTERLRDAGVAPEVISKIKAPIGLFGKARDARSLALSVIADIAACRQAALSAS
ncbi:XdhC family protein [Rhizobium sp. Leaf311]|uniref:XdhC family protein n=1 Tax=Rhizobium sp. Leaf311 TaxID=1736332 RepID=UPI0009EA0E8E|nr:XdhC family protein [Rhizobium sp. Leaf311]